MSCLCLNPASGKGEEYLVLILIRGAPVMQDHSGVEFCFGDRNWFGGDLTASLGCEFLSER